MYALALGIGTRNQKGEWLEVYYPRPVFRPGQTLVDEIASVTGYTGGNTDIGLDQSTVADLGGRVSDASQKSLLAMLSGSAKPLVLTLLDTDSALRSTPGDLSETAPAFASIRSAQSPESGRYLSAAAKPCLD